MHDRTCAVPACDRPQECRGWCHMHYTRWRATGDPEKVKKAARSDWGRACTVDECQAPAKSRGLCNKHYRRVLKFGDPTAVRKVRDHDGRCSVDGCERPYVARGWCSMHWQRVNELGAPGGVDPKWRYGPASCLAPGCERPHRTHGYCASHSQILVFAPRRRAAVDELVRLEIVAERDEWRCGICAGAVDPALRHPDSLSWSLDHIIPIAKGGRHHYQNVQLAHLLCNVRKSDRLIH